MASCPTFDPLASYVPTVVAFVDCHARALGEDGYRALGAGSPIGMVISGFVTIYIGLIGYRMLFGDLPQIREIVLAAVKIGAVLAVATQWSAYQVLVYDIAIDEPAALAARIFPAGGLGGDDLAGLTQKAQSAYDGLETILHPEPGKAVAQPSAPLLDSGAATTSLAPAAPTQRRALSVTELDSLTNAEKIFLVSTLGGLLSTRVVAAVLLALGPLFIAFFLFDATRGLFVGWVRALAATIVASVGVLAVLGMELALFGPQVSALSKALEQGFWVPTLIGEVAATSLLFALLIATTLVGTGIAAFGMRLPDTVRDRVRGFGERLRAPSATFAASPGDSFSFATTQANERSRAQLVADAVGALDRREDARSASVATVRTIIAGTLDGGQQSRVAEPMGQSRNRTTKRHSARARQRDQQP